MFPLVVLVVISFACTSKLPPSCGVVSATTSASANSRAVSPEFTFITLPAALPKLTGVSFSPVNVVLPNSPELASAMINCETEESYFNILSLDTPAVFTSDRAFKVPRLFNLVWSASVKTLLSVADSTSVPLSLLLSGLPLHQFLYRLILYDLHQ